MNIDQHTVDIMSKKGISFVADIPAPAGNMSITLTSKQISKYISDPIQFAADLHGVLKHQYLDWVETDGSPRCGVKTKSGKRCQNYVSGGCQYGIDDWLQLDGGFCAVHGGESSNEARLKRGR